MVHFYRNVMTVVPRGRVKEVAAMLKAIHAQEDAAAAREKAQAVVAKLESMKLAQAAQIQPSQPKLLWRSRLVRQGRRDV